MTYAVSVAFGWIKLNAGWYKRRISPCSSTLFGVGAEGAGAATDALRGDESGGAKVFCFFFSKNK
jgi:hypothetical protein